jgi:hypothetical protein
MNDATLICQAFGRVFRVPDHRFYLSDSGFGGYRSGIIIPFPNTRYYLQEWRDSGKLPECLIELYNLSTRE